MALLVTLCACSTTDSWVDAHASDGWSAQYAGAGNASYTPVAGARSLNPDWIRSVKGDLAAQVALGSGNYLAVNAQTAAGCSLLVWETDNRARQRWCTRLWQGGGLSSPLFGGFDNVYVGQPGAMLSFPPTQWIRWRIPVIGLPLTPRILAPGQLLVVTHLGQVQVLDAHSGSPVGTSVDLVAGLNPADSERGLADCRSGLPGCPVAAAPAYSPVDDRVVLTLWAPGAPAPVVVGLRYRPGGTPLLSQDWSSSAVGGGPLGSPVFAADGRSVYLTGRDGRLWALDPADGTVRWSAPLGYRPQTPPSVTPDGLIVAGGGPDAQLVALRDRGDRAEVVWRRADATPLCTTSLSAGSVGYTVTRDEAPPAPPPAPAPAPGTEPAAPPVPPPPAPGMTLTVFDTADGHTLSTRPLPNASGYPVGVSVGHDRRVVVAGSDGKVFGFVPAS